MRVLLEGHDYTLGVSDERELATIVRTVYDLDPETRTLRNVANLLPRHLSERLHRWVHGEPDGQYAFLFDNEADTLEMSRFLCVDFEGLDRYPQLVEPLLFYLLHRANAVIYDPALASKLKLFFIDEAWRFFKHPAIARYVVEALKTWRKKNAALILSTQSVDDLVKSDLLEVLVESCGTKLFLANPSLNEELYRDVLKLPETAIELIRAPPAQGTAAPLEAHPHEGPEPRRRPPQLLALYQRPQRQHPPRRSHRAAWASSAGSNTSKE